MVGWLTFVQFSIVDIGSVSINEAILGGIWPVGNN